MMNQVCRRSAAPKVFVVASQGSQSVALGLALAAASQLVDLLNNFREVVSEFFEVQRAELTRARFRLLTEPFS